MFPVVSLVLAAAFAWAAVAKAVRAGAWTEALAGYGLPPAARRLAAPGVPLAEAATAVLLVLGGDAARAGAALSIALLAAFSLAVLRARRLQGDRLPCGCFGRSDTRDYRALLVRNALLGSLAGAILLVPGFARWDVDAPAGSEVVPALLVGAGVALIAWLAGSLWRLGR